MNGQAHRLEIARSIIEHGDMQRIIETGTYKGTTTEWLASFELPVDTVEVNPRFHEFAARRLAEFTNVRLHFGDSVTFLRKLADQREAMSTRHFIYLDAHWLDHLPLRQELHIIFGQMPRSVVMVDDFQVPDDSGYGHDDYGPGKALTPAYLKDLATPFSTFFPVAAARWETGAKRGCVVLTADNALREVLDNLPCLRRA